MHHSYTFLVESMAGEEKFESFCQYLKPLTKALGIR